MSVHLYPVPGAEAEVESFIEPFLDNTVSEEGLSPESQFLILVFGESSSTSVDTIEETVQQHSAVAQQALEIEQLVIERLDERRLNTFTTSLLFNLLAADDDTSLQRTLESDLVSDEDKRKIDYYLPRVNDTVSEMVSRQSEVFEEKLDTIYPVDLDAEAARDMNDRLEDDIVTEQTIIDYLLLAASSTEDRVGIKELVKYVRENKIDESGYLSGGSEGVAGYKRVFSLSYDLPSDEFRDEFRTARSLYEEGATPELLQLLNQTDAEIEFTQIYNHESAVEQMVISQFGGNDRETGRRLLRAINGTRAVQNNREEIQDQFEESKADLEATIEETREEIERLEDFNDRFAEPKIQLDAAEIDQFETLLEKIENVDSAVAHYLLGVEREKRTSVFTTLERRLENHRAELEGYRNTIADYITKLDQFGTDRETQVNRISSALTDIRSTSIEIEFPEEQSLQQDLETKWDEQIAELESDLTVVDLTESDNEIERSLSEWETQFETTESELNTIAMPVSKLDTFSSDLQEIEGERDEVREMLSEIIEIVETSGGEA